MRARVGKSAETTWAQAHANERRWDRIGLPGLALCILALIAESVWPGSIPLPVAVLLIIATATCWARSMYWHGLHTGITHGREAEARSRTTRPTYLWTDDGAMAEQRTQADG